MDQRDHGHRYGNFPNYYSFHPPQNRLDVLIRTGILDYITSRLGKPILLCGTLSTSTDGDDVAAASMPEIVGDPDRSKYSGKKPRLHTDSLLQRSNHLPYEERQSNSRLVFYCDLGCNEGDLTMAMAELLLNGIVAKLQKSNMSSQEFKEYTITCLGLDIDPLLIERANSKYPVSVNSLGATDKAYDKDQTALNALRGNVLPSFKAANLCFAAEHNSAVYLSLAESTALKHASNKQDSETPNPIQEQEDIVPRPVFQLTTIFSTTMWIHVHAGDEGLKSFLERACGWTKNFLLVEPQPSGCYRKANTRLRKMGRPELNDVTSTRLKLRPDIEREIEKIIINAGFQRIPFDPKLSNELISQARGPDRNGIVGAVTSWNRTLHLYERKDTVEGGVIGFH